MLIYVKNMEKKKKLFTDRQTDRQTDVQPKTIVRNLTKLIHFAHTNITRGIPPSSAALCHVEAYPPYSPLTTLIRTGVTNFLRVLCEKIVYNFRFMNS